MVSGFREFQKPEGDPMIILTMLKMFSELADAELNR